MLQASALNAQRNCGTMSSLAAQIEKDSTLEERMEEMERNLQRIIRQNRETGQRMLPVITIPVVFHVLYINSVSDETNISDAQILSQIEVLNEDFRATNLDITNVRGDFSSDVADIEIEFCLAAFDPDGNPTSGITRKLTSITQFNADLNDCKFDSTGGTDIWNRDRFLNVWVVPGITNNEGNTGIVGYAQFPDGGAASTDGVVCRYTTIGRPPHNPFPGAFNLGRTTTHEIGHWLNLRHIWGDDCGDSTNVVQECAGTDLVDDTPDQRCANGGCPTFPRLDSCSLTSPGVMFMNYMDYVDDDCMIMFSNGQKERMRATLDGFRSSLQNINQCCPPSWLVSGVIHGFDGRNYYRAANQIESNNTLLTQDSKTVFQAGDYIDLDPGFRSLPGSFFIARPGSCETLSVDTRSME